MEECLPFPQRVKDWDKIEGFRTRWQFPNCIGALDGKFISLFRPNNSGSEYWNYKKFYSVALTTCLYL